MHGELCTLWFWALALSLGFSVLFDGWSRARVRAGGLGWVGRFGDLRAHWLMRLRYES